MAPRQSQASREYVIEERAPRVRDLPEGLRPREEMARVGPREVGDAVLLAILLRSGAQGMNVMDVAGRLLRRYGSLSAMAAAPLEELTRQRGIGPVKAQVLMAGLEIGRRIGLEKLPPRCRVRTPGDAAALVRDEARGLEGEVFWVVLLDAKNRVKGRPLEVSRGLLDASLVHPREVFRHAVGGLAAAVVLVHNHPSGDPTPSAEDVRVTRQLVRAGALLDIKVLDHVILGRPERGAATDFVSLREEGIVDFGT